MLSVGLVVDDAIVIVENVERHVREGQTPLDAALLGARELVGPVIAMTITLAAVYAPIAFQGGLTGSLFREFALTLAGAVFISGIVALTLSPVMSSELLECRARGTRPGRPHQPRFRPAAQILRPGAGRHAGGAPGGLYRLDRVEPAGDSVVHDVGQGTRADGGSGRC